MGTSKTQNWYGKLLDDCNSMAERFGLDDPNLIELRNFVEQVARDQYKNGSKSGYWFAKSGADKKMTIAPQAVAA